MYGAGAYGDYEYGGFNPDDALSIPDVLDTLIENPWLPRSWWVRARPRDASTSTTPPTLLSVDLSTDGHRTYPTDAEEIQLEEAIIVPYSLSYGLSNELYGQVDTTFGEIIIDDATNDRRYLANEDWIGRDVDVYVGPRAGIYLQFTKVAQLKSRAMRYDRSRLVLIIDDYGFVFNRPLQTNFYSGAGGLNGGTEIAGQPRPILIGVKRQFEPVLVDSTNLVYQIHDGAMESVIAVRDEGVALSFDANYADITTATPGVGEYSTSLSTGYIKLNAKNGKITCEAEGHNSSSYGYVDTISGIIKLLAITYAGLTDPDNLEPVSFSDLQSHTATMGQYFTTPTTIRAAMDTFHKSAFSWGWLRPNKVLIVGRIIDPDSATADFSLDKTANDVNIEPWSVDPFEIPVGRVVVGYRRYPSTMNDSEIDASIGTATRFDYSQEYRYAKSEDASVFVQTPDAGEVTILTDLDTESDAQALADEQLALRKVTNRRLVKVAPRTGLISRGVGQTFELTDDNLPDSPKKMTIIGVVNQAAIHGQDDRIELECLA